MIQPIGYRSLIRPLKDDKTKGGLFIPDNVNQKGILTKGEIVRVGKSKYVKEGDVVYYMKMATDEIDEDGITYSLIKNKHILAKVGK